MFPHQIAAQISWLAGVGAAPVVPPTIEYTHSASDGTNASSFTFNSVAIGTATSDRLVIVGVSGTAGDNSRAVTSVSIDGTNGTIHSNASSLIGNASAVASRVVSAGTSISVIVTQAGAWNRIGIVVATLKGYASATPAATAAAQLQNGVATQAITMTIPANGIAFYTAGRDASSDLASWSSATEYSDFQLGGEAARATAAGKYSATLLTSWVETVTWGSAGQRSAAAASWS